VEHAIVGVAALLVSTLAVFTGFGLGTVLLPVFALFFPPALAVGATAVVHGAANVLKVALLGRHADQKIVVRFGGPAIVGAFVGAAALGLVSGLSPLGEYSVGPLRAVVTPVNLVLAALIAGFGVFELHPRLRALEFDRRHLALGGALSGFFGGLSGHQGALRSAFLAKLNITTVAFAGTAAVVSLLVDLARIAVYGAAFMSTGSEGLFQGGVGRLVVTAVAAACVGVLIGRSFVRKVTMPAVQTVTGVMLLLVAVALGLGLT
jgi:uncharacterized membrane protein YfcA